MTRTDPLAEQLHDMGETDCPACRTGRDAIKALALELAAVRLALANERTDKEAAQQEAAELRDHRTASMAEALGATTTTTIAMLR